MTDKVRRLIGTVLRGVIGVGLACWLIKKVLEYSNTDLIMEIRQGRTGLLVLAAAFYFGGMLICFYRWQQLLAVQGVRLPYRTVCRLSLIGVFFNLVVPGAVGGDLVKMVYIARQAPGKGAEGVLTIMLDRVLGLLGLLLVAIVAIGLTFDFLLHDAGTKVQLAAGFVGLCGVGSLLTVGLLEWHERLERLPGVQGVVAWGATRLPQGLVATVRRVVQALDLYRTRRLVLAYALLLSALVHTCIALCVLCCGYAFRLDAVLTRHYFLATQVANAVGAIPLTPAGLGLRDVTLCPVLEAAGAPKEKAGAVATMLSVIVAASCLLGGIPFVLTRLAPVAPGAAGPPGAGAGGAGKSGI